jgi:hypothetical protein
MYSGILVGTADGLHELGGARRVSLVGHEVASVSKGVDGWWALVDDGEVWHSKLDADWARVASIDTLKARCLLPTSSRLFVGTSEAHLFSLTDGALEPLPSFDNTEGRDTWYTPWGGPPDVRSMSADPQGAI